MKLTMLAGSETGPARSINEDFCGIFEEDGLAVVCDGMGGHNAGANASRLAVTTIRYMYLFLDPAFHYQVTKDLIAQDLVIAARLVGSIRLANRNVYNRSSRQAELSGMGTTVSALAIQDGVAIIAHVGDSRIYRFRQQNMKLITEDHTWVNELIQDQEINREEARNFEKQNVITRALGLSGSIKIDVGIEPVQPGDLFLICTDGLTKALSDEEISRIVFFNDGNLDHTLHHLIDTAMMKDGSDNTTVTFVAIDEQELFSVGYDSDYLTLKAANKQVTQIEDKILKRELYHRTNSESPANSFSRIMMDKICKLSGIAAILIFMIFIGVYAFSDHRGKPNSNPITTIEDDSSLTVTREDSAQIPGNDSNQIGQQLPEQLSELESKTVPDSVVNQMIIASFENKDEMDQVSQVRSRSLRRKQTKRGRIYLTGLERFKDMENTSLFINNTYYGLTNKFWNRGLLLDPGSYTIIIRDSTNKILFLRKNIKLSAGDTKLVEIRGR